MGVGQLDINLTALAQNWSALDAMTQVKTGAVVKANGYGLGSDHVAHALIKKGVDVFFVATVEEGVTLRQTIGAKPVIYIFSGHMAGDNQAILASNLTPLLNSPQQFTRYIKALPHHPFGIQLDSGINRLGFEPEDWAQMRQDILARDPMLIISHLACADDPQHPMNNQQLQCFTDMTQGVNVPRSLAATGGILLGPDYHFDLTRPGIGLYGGLPFQGAHAVISLDLPVVQLRTVQAGEAVGYGNSYIAQTPRRIATVSGGYADGLLRHLSNQAQFFHGDIPCPLVGRVSMDLITVDVTDLPETPETLNLIGPHQTVDDLATMAQTIGYEILTALGGRYNRRYI